jgi:glycosyltransferase involved in cell wall biosynthesis
LVRLGSAVPMGQQAYESELLAALRRQFGDRWTISDLAVLPMRTAYGAGRRLPLRLVWAAPHRLAAAVGSLAYGRVDLVHRLDLRCPPSGRREVLTIHDLPPLRFDDEGSLPHWAARSARTAAAVICPSAFAAEEVRDLLGVRRTHVVPYGIDSDRARAQPLSQAELADLGLREPLVVHAAGATARKNLDMLASAWPEVVRKHPDASLALCGPPHSHRDELFSRLPNVLYLGHRPPTFVARLMRTATAVVVPSTYEGFGLPALEAMAAGATVVAAACGALPEVCADAALLVAPDPAEFAAAIGEALAGGSAIERLRTAGRVRAASFSWERAARETVAVYEGVFG